MHPHNLLRQYTEILEHYFSCSQGAYLENKLSDKGTKKDCIYLVLSISFSIFSYLMLAKFISIFYKPDISSILEEAKLFLIPNIIHLCKPEPLEKTLFIAGIFLIPALIFVYYLIIKTILDTKRVLLINGIWIFICLFTVIILPLFIFKVMNTPSVYVPSYSYVQLYITNSILDRNVSILVFVPFIIILYFFLRINLRPRNSLVNVTTILLDIFCLLLIACIATQNVISIYTNDNHFDSIFYSIVQLFKGVPLGIDGFTNAYGLYPYFLNFIFKITGLSVIKCSIVFCTLIALSFLLMLFFIKNTVNNKLLVFLGFINLANLSGAIGQFKRYGQILPYYQYMPLRYLFPCLLLLISALYIKYKNKYFYTLSSVICALSLLWNFDTGIITTISWMLLNLYSEFEEKNVGTILKNIIWHIIKISAVMIITISLFYLHVFILYGKIFNIDVLYQTFYIFSKLGYGMLPMPLLHPWNIIALSYIIGIGISISAIIEKNITPWTKNVFLVTIMGTGALLYYQGRSHDYSLGGPIFYFFILLTLFLDKILSFFKSNRNLLLEFLSILIVSILSLSVVLMLINVKYEFLILKTSIHNIQAPSLMKNIIQMDCNFIKGHTNPSEKIIILSHNSGIYFSKIPNISAFNPGLSELYLKSDYERLRKIIGESDVKIFADRTKETNYVTDILKYLEITDSNGHLFLLRKRNYNN